MSTDTTIRDDKPAIPETAQDISANLEALEDCVEQALGVALRELAEAQETGRECRYPAGFVVGMQAVLGHADSVRWTYEAAKREELLSSLQELRKHADRVLEQARWIYSLGVAASNGVKRMHSEIEYTAQELRLEHEALLANRPPVKD